MELRGCQTIFHLTHAGEAGLQGGLTVVVLPV
jgi:hypothetical protein